MSVHAIVIHPVIKSRKKDDTSDHSVNILRSPESCLEEAVNLASAIYLKVIESEIINLSKITPSLLFGKGIVEGIKERIKELEIDLVIIDHPLSPIQQRNLEKELECKVIDRTGLIIAIFGDRARTKEGVLQVKLASLSFERSRLVRSWTHLERQRGGLSATGGPGETQIEIDRRLIDEKIIRLKKDLEKVKKTRLLHRKSRQKTPFPIIAFVGYTNAGKSSLFNHLTGAEVFAKDLLFATLDPTMRAVKLPSGNKVILADTVGFISNLPTHLIDAFRATLEEVLEASVILHVRDIANKDTDAEKEDVLKILRELGIGDEYKIPIIEVLNKSDKLGSEDKVYYHNQANLDEDTELISAHTGEGVDDLLEIIDRHLEKENKLMNLEIDITDGKTISWLYSHGNVLDRTDDDEFAHMKVSLNNKNYEYFQKKKEKIN